MTCHLEIGKKRRRKKQLQQGDFRRKKNKKEVLLYIQRERRLKKRPEERGYELAGYLALQLHARETLWNTKVGWRMVNSLRCYTQMHPCCHMNYSSPAVCTGFWKNNQKKKDFKAGLKDEWMRARIKGASKYEVQKKKKERKIRWVAKHKHSHRNAGQSRGERLSRPSVPTYLFFHGRMTDATQRMGKHQTHAGEVKESEGTAKL